MYVCIDICPWLGVDIQPVVKEDITWPKLLNTSRWYIRHIHVHKLNEN